MFHVHERYYKKSRNCWHNTLYTYLLLAVTFDLISSKEIILSAGVGPWARLSTDMQYKTYKTYSEIGLISASSVLAYQISPDGFLESYLTDIPGLSGEQYQYIIKNNLKLKALPCIFCDSTIGACDNLFDRLQKVFKHEDQFINQTIEIANKYDWNGYSIDLELLTGIDSFVLTNFMIKWANELISYDLKLYVWIGGPTPYNLTKLFNQSSVNFITMETYQRSYSDFIYIASQLQIAVSDISKLGFGFLTYPTYINETDIRSITNWMSLTKTETINIWAATIPPEWYASLIYFLSGQLYNLSNIQ